ncbi:ABC transporter permease [Prochlorococcus marinus]|uniref:ABC transporter permease n=1 Tax=Prochlorococcus marinus XMU1408 TaxID=2213228 RepID=A0A318QYY0_PROMR|nr:ABC transporter permease [Prochlorococcus marinus]MBW3042312.1 ABC transporter permease [Prochlorococcus marinus str. XMU1408]PYE01698.1 ABC transporter permease [Prochlorococcus marinus XMU1408]
MSTKKELFKYIFSRLALLPIMLWLISSLVFILLRIAPGDPVDAILGTRANEFARESLRIKLGLDKPLISQYLEYLNNLIHGNLGISLNTQEPVKVIISKALPASIELAIFAILIASLVGYLIGFLGVIKPEGKIDFIGRIFGIGTYALPPFWAAMLIQIIFAVLLGWLPIGGRYPPGISVPHSVTGFLLLDSILDKNLEMIFSSFKHLILPSVTLGMLLSGIFSRSLRLNLEEVLKKNYIEAAKSRGISESRILIKHAFPNTLLPILTITGLTVSSLIGGALLIEITFSWPGIALGLQEAINQRDYPVVQGIVVTISSLVVMVSVGIDIAIAYIDPRVSY